MTEPVDTIDCDGLTIKVWQDGDPDDPRDWDNLGTMTCFHRRYSLGDEHSMSQDELREIVAREDVVSLPLYLLDHSGITMRTGSAEFRACDPQAWDWGMVGYIWVERDKVLKECPLEAPWREWAERILQGEVETYDDYLTGNVYGYTIETASGDVLDSCFGYYGDPKESDLIAQAKGMVEWHRKQFVDALGQQTGEPA